jgi:hypothetical protein
LIREGKDRPLAHSDPAPIDEGGAVDQRLVELGASIAEVLAVVKLIVDKGTSNLVAARYIQTSIRRSPAAQVAHATTR